MIGKIFAKYRKHKYNKIQKKLKVFFPTSDISSYASISNAKLEGENVIKDHANISKSFVGFATVIGKNSNLSNSKIGRFCSIAKNVQIVTATHPLDLVSTYPGFYNTVNVYPFGKGTLYKDEFLKTDNGFSVEIGNDVWIGQGVTLKGGIKIGDGAVIGMNSTVTKDIPPYSIVCGVPARIVRYRMNEQQIKDMLDIKWWNWEPEIIKERREEFTNIEVFIKKYKYK